MPSSTSLKFSLKIGSLAPDKFRVLEFTMNEAVSECFHLHIQASCDEGDLAYGDLIGMDATLKVEGKDFPISHHGVVTEFNQYPDGSENFGHETYLYDIVVEPRFKLLSYNTQNRIFQKKDLKKILEDVFKANAFAAANYDLTGIKGTLREREYTVQYNETDLDFVSRLLEDEGVYYWFDHTGEKEKLILADSVDGIKPVPETPAVDLMGEAGLSHLAKEGEAPDHVSRMRRTQRMVTGKVTVKDYNDRTPGVNVIGKASKPGQGEHYQYGPQALNTSEAERIAGLRAEMHAAGKVRLEGESICRAFRAGMRFELKDPAGRSHFEGKYAIVRVLHHGDQREGFEGGEEKLIYSNSFQCMPADVVYRPALRTPKPRIHGILSAKVDGVEGRYAYLDDDGRYHAKLPFDLSDLKDGQASLPVRMNQPYGGPNYGMHFPVHNGNEMVLGFEDGDPDRPIMLGTVPNPSNGSPVNKRNSSESIIRTASGHQIRLDDKEGKTIIDLQTSGSHLLAMNDNSSSKQILIKTSGGHSLLLDDSGKHITLKSTDGHSLKIDDTAKSVTVSTAGGHSLVMDDPGKTITVQDGQGVNTITLDGGGKLLHISSKGDIQIDAGKSIVMTAKETFKVEAGKDMTLHTDASAAISVKKGMKLDVTEDLAAAAKKIEMKADTDFKIAGKKIDMKAESDFKVDSGKANIKSSGDMVLKGSKVSQN
jgi:type VI secretion system secreted protein VgrG